MVQDKRRPLQLYARSNRSDGLRDYKGIRAHGALFLYLHGPTQLPIPNTKYQLARPTANNQTTRRNAERPIGPGQYKTKSILPQATQKAANEDSQPAANPKDSYCSARLPRASGTSGSLAARPPAAALPLYLSRLSLVLCRSLSARRRRLPSFCIALAA